MRELKSFKIHLKNKVLDYRQSEDLDLEKVRSFFSKKYQIEKLWKVPRHVLGIFVKGNQKFFLKLSTSEGIGIITENEYNWNDYFNKYNTNSDFLVPKNYDKGIYNGKYFYLITDYFEGSLLCEIREKCNSVNFIKHINQIIGLSETIQELPQSGFVLPEYEEINYKIRFLNKTVGWFEDINNDLIEKYKIGELLEVVKSGIDKLESKPRHGDFTPWHILKLKNNKLGLIDGEHAFPDGVENYDICYLIQRVFSILKNPQLAQAIYSKLIERKYDKNKLKIVLASRAIGGFLDVSLNNEIDYQFAIDFKNWVLST